MALSWNRSDASFLLMIGLVTGLGFLLRWDQLDASLWLDELNTAWTVAGSHGELVERAWVGNQTPLFFWLPCLAVWLGGFSEYALRFPSLCAGVLLIPSIAWLVHGWSGSSVAALTVACWVATDRTCVFYAQEARVYACLQLTAVIQIGVFCQLLRCSSNASPCPPTPIRFIRLLYVGISILLFYLHYTSILLLFGELTWWWLQRRARYHAYPTRSVAIDFGLIFIAIFPVLWHLKQIGSQRQMWERLIAQQPLWTVVSWFRWDVYVFLPMLLFVLIAVWESRRSASVLPRLRMRLASAWQCRTEGIGLAMAWMLVPAFLAWVITELNVARLFWPRYLLASAVAPMVLGSLVLASIPHRRLRQWLGISFVLISLLLASDYQTWLRTGRFPVMRGQDWRAAAAILTQNSARPTGPFVDISPVSSRPSDPLAMHGLAAPELNTTVAFNRLHTESNAAFATANSDEQTVGKPREQKSTTSGPTARASARLSQIAITGHPTFVPIYGDDKKKCWSDAGVSIRLASHVDGLESHTDRRPVFVRSGLLEADRLSATSSPLQYDLCRSPLLTIYTFPEAASRLIPLPSSDAGRLTRKAIDRIEQQGGAWFVINGTARLQTAFQQDLEVRLPATAWRLKHWPLTGSVQVWELAPHSP